MGYVSKKYLIAFEVYFKKGNSNKYSILQHILRRNMKDEYATNLHRDFSSIFILSNCVSFKLQYPKMLFSVGIPHPLAWSFKLNYLSHIEKNTIKDLVLKIFVAHLVS